MTYEEYTNDLKRVRVALADAVKAVDALATHDIPDWLIYHIGIFKARVDDFDSILSEHQQENQQ